jgi:hypothetical protein
MVRAKEIETGDGPVAEFSSRFLIDGSDVGLLRRSVKRFVVSNGLSGREDPNYTLSVCDT